jgi:hemoglobin-like flavoprotein
MSLPVDLLEESFDLVAPRGEELADAMYRRLFEFAPETIPLFAHTDLADRRRTMLATLVVLRKSLRKLDSLLPALAALGARHATYGVRPEHYNPAGQAVLDALAEIGGAGWRPEYTSAWTAAWCVIRDVMLGGAPVVGAKCDRAEKQEPPGMALEKNHALMAGFIKIEAAPYFI